MDDNGKAASVFDTDRQHLGDVYAKALLSIGEKTGSIDELIDELQSLVSVVADQPKLRAMLESPRVKFADKQSIIDKMLQGRATKTFVNFIKVLTRKGRFDCLAAVAAAAQEMNDERAGRLRATMTTAEQVDDNVKNRVASRLSQVLGKTVLVRSQVDPQIIGGLMIRIGDTVYDASIQNQLKQVRSAAIDRANQEIRGAIDRFALEA